MSAKADDFLCDGTCSDFRYFDDEWGIWICSLCDRPLAVTDAEPARAAS